MRDCEENMKRLLKIVFCPFLLFDIVLDFICNGIIRFYEFLDDLYGKKL